MKRELLIIVLAVAGLTIGNLASAQTNECAAAIEIFESEPSSLPSSGWNKLPPLTVLSRIQAKIDAGCLGIGGSPSSNFPAAKLHVKGGVNVSGAVGIGGNLTVLGTINGTTVGTSDQRLKQNINPLGSMLAKILSLRPVSFEWQNQNRGSGTKLGLIAQEVEQVFPEVVSEGDDGYKGINYDALTGPLLKTLQEQQAILAQQEAELLRLEREILSLAQ